MAGHKAKTKDGRTLYNLRRYIMTATARRYHASNSFVKCIIGCVGAGKTTISIVEMITRSLEQQPDANGVRKTRHVIVRNTYPELETTVMNSIKLWLPEKLPDGTPFLKVRYSYPLKLQVSIPLADGTRADIEMLLLALNGPDDVPKLRSLEVTTCLLSEASELCREVYDMACTRVGRYPASEEDDQGNEIFGPTYHGVLIESNPPPMSHWIYELGVVERPSNWAFFRQPPAMFPVEKKERIGGIDQIVTNFVLNTGQRLKSHGIPEAENLSKLPSQYYQNQIQGRAIDWIRVYVCGEFGHVMSGRPVYPEWNVRLHKSKSLLSPSPGLPVIVGLDYGLDHSAAICQLSPNGQLQVIDELISENCGSRRFIAEHLRPLLTSARYAHCKFIFIGDPAGSQRSQSDERSCMDIFAEEGYMVSEAPTNNFLARRDAVARFLSLQTSIGPGFIIDARAETLISGFDGGYHYKRLRTGDTYAPAPDKNNFSHSHDALQYAALYFTSSGGVVAPGGDPFSEGSNLFRKRSRKRKPIRRKPWIW